MMRVSVRIFVLFILWRCTSATFIQHGNERCLNLTPSPFLEKFVDPLPIIPEINLRKFPSITLAAYKIQQKLHRDLPPTTLYAYGTSKETAIYPGPTLIAEEGYTANVYWDNQIKETEHILPLDTSLRWANPRTRFIPTVTHLHGHESEPAYDGHPQAWVNAVGETGPTFVSKKYVYQNTQLPAMLWYHDHTYGITRLNVAAGLLGAYIIHSKRLKPSWVPSSYHVLVIQDKSFYEDGYIKYPDIGINPSVHPKWCPDYFGDVVLVNGKAWPYLDVGPDVYRFRIVNGANSRFYFLRLSNPALRFYKIGTDGGYLHTPLLLDQMVVAPAERVDCLIDFSKVNPSETVEMTSTGPEPFIVNGTIETVSVMQFRVTFPPEHPSSQIAEFPVPLTNESWSRLSPLELIRKTSGWDLSHVDWNQIYYRPEQHNLELDSGGGLVTFYLNDMSHFEDPATEVVKLGSNEVWALINNIIGAHVIHTHLVNFVVTEQQPFDPVRLRNGTCTFKLDFPDPRSCFSGPAQPPDPDMLGRKDTALVKPFHVHRFFLVFRPSLLPKYQIDPTKFPGYVWHCHLLEHEDNEMMRPFLFSNTGALYTNKSFPPSNLYYNF